MLFQGDLYITLDSCYAVKQADFSVNREINLNWVKEANINLLYKKENKQGWLLESDQVTIDFGLPKTELGVYGQRTTTYNDYKTETPHDEAFYKKASVENDSVAIRPDSYWFANRPQPLSYPEQGIYTMLAFNIIHNLNVFISGKERNRNFIQSPRCCVQSIYTKPIDYQIKNIALRFAYMVGDGIELPATLGTGVPKTNNTDMKTQGFELEVSWKDRLANGLGYGVKVLLSNSTSKITRYANPTGTLDKYYSGENYGEIWGYTTKGIAKSDDEMNAHLASLKNGGQSALGSNWKAGDIMYADVNGDGKIDNGANTLTNHELLPVPGNPRTQPVCVAVKKAGRMCLFVAGGFASATDNRDASLSTDAYCYEPDINRWTKIAEPCKSDGRPISLGGGVAVSLGDSLMLCMGMVSKETRCRIMGGVSEL